MSDESVVLDLTMREVAGKAVKRLREEGVVPAVIHDHGKPSLSVQAPYLATLRVYQRAGKHHPVQLTVGSHKFVALIKSATFDPKKHQLTHVVFNAVNKNQKVEAEVPVKPRYAEGQDSTPAERASLIVLEQLDTVEIRAIPDRLPDALFYDAEKLVAEGDQVFVADLEVPEGVEVVTEPEHPLATVTTPAALEAANAAIAGDAEEAAPAEAAAEGETPAEGGEAAAESEEKAA